LGGLSRMSAALVCCVPPDVATLLFLCSGFYLQEKLISMSISP